MVATVTNIMSKGSIPEFKVPITINVKSDSEEALNSQADTSFPAVNSQQRVGSNSSSGSVYENRRPPPPVFKGKGSLAPPPVTSSSSGLSPARGPPKPRKKVALKPGYSAIDWANLRNSGKNLRGVGAGIGIVRIDKEELQRHKTKEDCWTVLGGRVYNLTPYLPFHPGGEKILMAIAGRDGTSLFMKTHSWVSFENMLDKCLVGFYSG